MITFPKPYVLITDTGEGFSCEAFDSLKDALIAPKYGTQWAILKTVEFSAAESSEEPQAA